MNRVVITGMGAVTPLGNNAVEFWENLKNGVNGIDSITKFDTEGFKVKLAAEVKGFDPSDYIEKKELKRLDLFSQYGISAACEAFNSSGLKIEELDATRVGIIAGSGIGGLCTIEEQIRKMIDKGPSRVNPLFIPMVIGNMVAGNIAIKIGAKGICTSIVTACASGTNSIGEAFRNIKHGYSDIIIAGGSEATINQIGIAGFTVLTALSTSEDKDRASIPFDKERNGFVMGEGAGMVVLEEYEHAKKRGAKIYAEIVGYGSTADAYHMTSPSPDGAGAKKAMKDALDEAGILPTDITYINAHGTSTPQNDKIETLAIKEIFGDYAKELAISSTKSMTGHLLGAAGAIEAIACIKALEEDFVPPTINYKVPDEECDLTYVPNKGIPVKMKYAVSNSFGFGGHNGVICLKKWDE